MMAATFWDTNFAAPVHPTSVLIDRSFIPVAMVSMALVNRSTKAVQGPIARSGETLLLAFDAD